MSKIEEVKKILNNYETDNQHFRGVLCTLYHELATEINQLYEPQPDQSRLLTDKDIERKLISRALEKHGSGFLKRFDLDDALKFAIEIRDKIASIKDAEWERNIFAQSSERAAITLMKDWEKSVEIKHQARIEALIKDLMLLHYNLETWEWERASKQHKWAIDKALTEIKRMYEELKANPTSEEEG